jgi:opacity protein-like surface antigen
MKKHFAIIAAIILILPALAYSNILSLKVGYFVPRAQSGLSYPDSLWTIEFDNMSFTKTSYQDAVLSLGYEYFVAPQLSFVVSVDTYRKNRSGYYKDYVGIGFTEGDFAFPNDFEGDFSITHSFNVSITPLQLSLKLTPLGRRARFIPYVGGGVGLYIWSVRLQGDMIDFADPYVYTDPDGYETDVYPIVYTYAKEPESGLRFSVGYHVFAGFMFPIAQRITLETEFKFNSCKGVFKEAFIDFSDFDLSSYQITVGINYWF